MGKLAADYHRRIVTGVEVESYTILMPEYDISRRLAFPRKGLGEAGERFVRDWSMRPICGGIDGCCICAGPP